MEPARFFALAYRLPAYEGVLAIRLEEEREAQKKYQPKVPEGTKIVPENALISTNSDLFEMK